MYLFLAKKEIQVSIIIINYQSDHNLKVHLTFTDIKKLYHLASDKHMSSIEIIEGYNDFTNLQNHVRKDIHLRKEDKNPCGKT